MPMLARWRTSLGFPRRLRVRQGIDFAAVRRAASLTADAAMIGASPIRLVPGYVIEADGLQGNWLHISQPAPWGFSHDSLYEPVNADAPIGPPAVVPLVPPAPDDLAFVHEPRISGAQWEQILIAAHSPASPHAAAMYAACVEEEVDPALLLAFFAQESSYGTRGLCIAYDLKNPGNVRTPMDASRGDLVTISGRGTFTRFHSWADGARDWGERMREKYTRGLGLPTVRAALPTYAPSSDGNHPASYAEAVIQRVRGWQAAQ